MTRHLRRRAAVPCLAAAALLGGCTATSAPKPVDRTVVRTIVTTRTPGITVTAVPAATAKPLPPGVAASTAGEGAVERRCPYIASSQDQSPVSAADIEGDRVYRTVVLTALRPVGCRFYFWAPPYEAIADIVPRTYASARDAHNALVLTAGAGTDQISAPGFVPGADGISYRTRFFAPDGARDWAFAFAKRRVLVIVRTQRVDTSRNALYLAKAIVGKF